MNHFLSPLEIFNLYFSNGASRGNAPNKLWQGVNNLFTWDNLIHRNFQRDMAPFLYYIISMALPRMSKISPYCKNIKILIPENVISWLKVCHQASLFRNMVLLNEQNRITRMLEKNGIKAIPLKGGYLAENVYENIACRPMKDLDLLVRDCDKENTFKLLSLKGYKLVHNVPSSRELHEVFIKEVAGQNVFIEVHNRLVKNKFRKRFDLNGLFEVGHIPFYFQILYFCWHTVRHGVMRFMWLCDLAELLRHRETRIDWEHLLHTAVVYNVKQETVFILYLVSVLLGSPMLIDYSMKPGIFRRLILEKIFLNEKSHLSAQDETMQRFAMTLVLMKPLDILMLLPSYISRVAVENRRNFAQTGTCKNVHK
jgi:hypothetical protein